MDADAFFNLVTFDGNGVICVDLDDGKRSLFYEFQFGVAVGNIHKDLIVEFEFMFGEAFVGAKKTGVDKSLAMFGESDDVGYKQEVKEHVAIENQGAREVIAKS